MSEKRGRPVSSNPKNNRITLRITDEELEKLEYMEYMTGLSKNEVLRKALNTMYKLTKNMM